MYLSVHSFIPFQFYLFLSLFSLLNDQWHSSKEMQRMIIFWDRAIWEKKKKKSSWGRQRMKGHYIVCQCLDRQLSAPFTFYFFLCFFITGSVSLFLSLSLNPVESQFSLSLASKEHLREHSNKGILFKVDTRIMATFLDWPQEYFHDYPVFLKNYYFSAICASLEVLILCDDYCIHMVMM